MSEHAGEIAELRQDIRTERERIDAIKKELFDRMLEFTEKTNKWQLGIERAIGRLEGKIEVNEKKGNEK